MVDQITKRQHQVPQFYIKLWADNSNQVYLYDLKHKSTKLSGSKSILFDEFYYEEDPTQPDNKIENILGEIETESAPLIKLLNEIVNKYPLYSQGKQLKEEIEQILTLPNQSIIKRFSAFQYLRIPGAVDQKKYELKDSSLQKTEIDYALNPGRFVETGFDYLKNRFEALMMVVNYSFDDRFLTSDWPCFDMKDSKDAPLLGEEIGYSREVIACITLGPRLRVIFYPANYKTKTDLSMAPSLTVKSCANGQVKNHNSLIIQQAIRYVISQGKVDFIFKASAKRKRDSF